MYILLSNKTSHLILLYGELQCKQRSISADSFGHYRLELAVDLTEEEGDQMVHQLAGLGD